MTHTPDSHALATATNHLPDADRRLFRQFGRGPASTPPYRLIHRPIEEHAAARPDAVAAEHLGETLTYGELDRHAERLAAVLTGCGVGAGDTVGVFLRRSLPMLVGLLGTLKAGAAYVPQDVGVAPAAQLRHVMRTARTKVVLTVSDFAGLVPVPEGTILVNVDEVMSGALPPSPAYPLRNSPGGRRPAVPDDPCYVLFTSGTTGTPNGVVVTHRNVCNIVLTEPGSLGIRPGLRVAQLLNIAFDMASWEILGCLAHGATLLVRGRDIAATAERADVLIATPTVLSRIDPARCARVRTVAVAGEPCPVPLADAWAGTATFYNCCGPTETTIVNTMHRHTPGTGLTIGRPTPNNTVYVLDDRLRPLPIGEIGEMWAGGDCVSAGYLDYPSLNAERYAPDPFIGGGRMMFRTRDLGRWTPEGELEHLGRTDDQVKVRGFRVELDSVSAVLESVPGCRQAVTLQRDGHSLVSFVTPADVDTDAARRAVAAALPYYCTPAEVHALDALPVTARGKTDKALLRRLATAAPVAALTPAVTQGAVS
ncbi:amino acid adenylation domain-containing protein [Streptomyces sp. WMMC500]|uniref:amino acid adenylation domain-containing protein n=1 Tax=Streptomyces sp. WMMC500 TaxID=3015154 RepID=UPI00248A9E0C|nr:amino acid adenylation domain-containing protein [Streptomyces sp. WMMC500]WBB64424.1 amino acid adenylation domain-containing protein [Streptomyces sp. WMMC500]